MTRHSTFELVSLASGAPSRSLGSLAAIVGSFDPLHRGHQWMVEQLLERFEAVALLIPTWHFEKRVRFPENATLPQRLELIERAYRAEPARDRIWAGLTGELLFLRLACLLERRFAGARIGFGMGSDTYRKLLASPRYYARLGLRWGERQRQALEALCSEVVVFDRGGQPWRGAVPAPFALQHVSSTRVRQLAARLHASGASTAAWERALGPLLAPQVIGYLRERGLYRPATPRRCQASLLH